MFRSKYGFLTEFDTNMHNKHLSKHKEIVLLRLEGKSHRDIGIVVGVPKSSVTYILKHKGLGDKPTTKPSLDYLSRAECKAQYDMSNNQFNYARKMHKNLTVKVGIKVYLHISYIKDYMWGRKAYKSIKKDVK